MRENGRIMGIVGYLAELQILEDSYSFGGPY